MDIRGVPFTEVHAVGRPRPLAAGPPTLIMQMRTAVASKPPMTPAAYEGHG